MSLRMVSMPGGALGLAEIKDHVRIDGAHDDALVDSDLHAAIEQVERAAHVGFCGATWEWAADCFPSGNIEMGFGPVTSVEAITYVDAEGAPQTLAPSAYTFDVVSTAGLIFPLDEWPETHERANIRVRFVAGDGTIPAPINRAIRMVIADGYEGRLDGGELTGAAQRMVGQYRRVWF
ncbi:MAG: hypothetical protein V2I43_08765 [Parvularcula sp.]|jgi:uncharacterized phiE125 gp8 family phage protein|nr:hypothetical protein [Parvularcula sp.]